MIYSSPYSIQVDSNRYSTAKFWTTYFFSCEEIAEPFLSIAKHQQQLHYITFQISSSLNAWNVEQVYGHEIIIFSSVHHASQLIVRLIQQEVVFSCHQQLKK